jgi:hypothetical protein
MAGIQRFVVLLLIACGVTAVVSLVFGFLIGASPSRALSVGFYGVGCFLLVGGFFVGNRGPARLKGEDTAGPFGLGTRRRIRWATAEERDDAISTSAIFVVLGFALILLGVIADSRHELI